MPLYLLISIKNNSINFFHNMQDHIFCLIYCSFSLYLPFFFQKLYGILNHHRVCSFNMCCLALSRVNTTPFCGRVPSLKLKLTNHAAKHGDCSNEESQPKEDSLWKDLLKREQVSFILLLSCISRFNSIFQQICLTEVIYLVLQLFYSYSICCMDVCVSVMRK